MALNQPAAIEALEQPLGLPPRLLEQANEVRTQGGARTLSDSLANIVAISKRCSELVPKVRCEPHQRKTPSARHDPNFAGV